LFNNDHEQTNEARPNKSRVFLLKHITQALPDLSGHLIFWSLSLTGTALDLWTKKIVFEYLQTKPDYSVTIIKGFFSLVTALNNGAAFGIVQGQSFLLTLISFFALLIVIAVFLFGSIKNRFYQVTMGLLAAGISGNLYDRIFNDGSVRDFIDVGYWPGKHWPAFNVADSLLCIAVGLILLVGLTQKPCQKHAQQQK